jgi:FAD/FMN-containing dehydrogenase
VKKKFVSLDHTYKQICKAELYERKKRLSDDTKYSIRGSGSSLCAASFGSGSTVLEQNPKYNFIEIDTVNNQINVSAQLTLLEVFKFLTPKKFYLKSVPSYPMATVGGCIAYNAHGQNHYRDGCFGNHVKEITFIIQDTVI